MSLFAFDLVSVIEEYISLTTQAPPETTDAQLCLIGDNNLVFSHWLTVLSQSRLSRSVETMKQN